MNRLYHAGANVVHKGVAKVHVSGHASAEELKLMLNLVNPDYMMPVHGEIRHLHAHRELAIAVGIPEENVFLLDNGDCLEMDEEGVRRGKPVASGVVYVDGLTVGDLGQVVLRDRQLLSSDGLAVIVVAVDTRTGTVVGDPEVITRGLVLGPDSEAALKGIHTRVDKVLKRTAAEGVTDSAVIRKALHDAVSQYVWETAKRRPMIIPTVMEV
jgi:ribonuclease J